MKVTKDGVVFEIAEVAATAAIRNGYKIVTAAAEDEKPKKQKKK